MHTCRLCTTNMHKKCTFTHSHDHIYTHRHSHIYIYTHRHTYKSVHIYTHARLQTHDVHKVQQTHKHTLSLPSTKSREHLYLCVSLPCTRPYPASLLVKAQEQIGQTPEIASQCLTSSPFCSEKLGSSRTGRCLWGSGSRSHGWLTTLSPFITCTC